MDTEWVKLFLDGRSLVEHDGVLVSGVLVHLQGDGAHSPDPFCSLVWSTEPWNHRMV